MYGRAEFTRSDTSIESQFNQKGGMKGIWPCRRRGCGRYRKPLPSFCLG